MKVTGTGRSSTWFKGNIFQADSRKRVFFYAVPEKHFLLIIFDRDSSAFVYRIMMAKLAISVNASINHHWFIISWPDMNMKMRIRFGCFFHSPLLFVGKTFSGLFLWFNRCDFSGCRQGNSGEHGTCQFVDHDGEQDDVADHGAFALTQALRSDHHAQRHTGLPLPIR